MCYVITQICIIVIYIYLCDMNCNDFCDAHSIQIMLKIEHLKQICEELWNVTQIQ